MLRITAQFTRVNCKHVRWVHTGIATSPVRQRQVLEFGSGTNSDGRYGHNLRLWQSKLQIELEIGGKFETIAQPEDARVIPLSELHLVPTGFCPIHFALVKVIAPLRH